VGAIAGVERAFAEPNSAGLWGPIYRLTCPWNTFGFNWA